MSLDFSLSLMGLCFCFCVFIYLFLFASILFAFVYLNTVSFIILHTLLLSVWEECVPEKYFCDFSRGISTSVIGYNFSQLATPGSPCQPILEDLCSSTCSNKSRSDEVSGHCTIPFTHVRTTATHYLLAKLRMSLINMTAPRTVLGFDE